MSNIYVITNDSKSRALVNALREAGKQARVLESYPFSVWIKFIRRGGVANGDVVIARYLNDNPSLLISLLKPFGDALTIIIAKFFNIRLFWLCHNINKETEVYWPPISSMRRWMWAAAAERILISDDSLMHAANAVFLRHREKLFPLAVGPIKMNAHKASADEDMRDIVEFFRKGDIEEKNRLNILVAGIPGEKYLHFSLLPRLVDELCAIGWRCRVVVAILLRDKGVQVRNDNYESFLEWCGNNEDVLVYTDDVRIDEERLRGVVDCIWRAMGDWSFPFTLINAARARIPVLAYDAGYLGRFIECEGIGGTVRWDFSNVEAAVERTLSVKEDAFVRFCETRTWEEGAKRLCRLTG